MVTYNLNGPYKVRESNEGNFTTFTPNTSINAAVIWMNGYMARPWMYGPFLRSIASWGIEVYAAKTSYAIKNTADKALHLINNNIKIGVAGHSRGGGMAYFEGTGNTFADAVVAISPWVGMNYGPYDFNYDKPTTGAPLLAICGDGRGGWSRQKEANFARNIENNIVENYGPTCVATLAAGKGHFEAAWTGGIFREPTIAWFRYHLLDSFDTQAVDVIDDMLENSGDWSFRFAKGW